MAYNYPQYIAKVEQIKSFRKGNADAGLSIVFSKLYYVNRFRTSYEFRVHDGEEPTGMGVVMSEQSLRSIAEFLNMYAGQLDNTADLDGPFGFDPEYNPFSD